MPIPSVIVVQPAGPGETIEASVQPRSLETAVQDREIEVPVQAREIEID